MMNVKQKKRKYIYSKIPVIVFLSLVFCVLCAVGKLLDNYLVIGGAVIYAFVGYIIFHNKMMAYIEQSGN